MPIFAIRAMIGASSLAGGLSFISAASGISASNLRAGTLQVNKGQAVQFRVLVTNTSTGNLTESGSKTTINGSLSTPRAGVGSMLSSRLEPEG